MEEVVHRPLKRRRIQYLIKTLEEHLDEMPASQFFWISEVPAHKKQLYLSLLGKLVLLFTAPHYYTSPDTLQPTYPYKECSYLKKFEAYLSLQKNTEWFMNNLYELLALRRKRKHIHVEKRNITINMTTGAHSSFSEVTLVTAVSEWFHVKEKKQKPLFLTELVVFESGDDSYHSTLLVVKREIGQITYFHLDPHGTEDQLQSNVIENQLKKALLDDAIIVTKLPIICPELQTAEQGGTCFQWFSMIFCFISLNPKLFEEANFSNFLQTLGEHSNFNILLFTMSMFLRTMPFGPEHHLKNISYINFKRQPSTLYEAVRHECNEDDDDYRAHMYAIMDKVNCSFSDDSENIRETCLAPCKICGDTRCVNKNLTMQLEEQCVPLNMKEIVSKMFNTYYYMRVNVLNNISTEEAQFFEDSIDRQLNDLTMPNLKMFITELLSPRDVAAVFI